MKLSKNTQYLIKIAILLFILLSCIYILFFFNNGYKIRENLANARDCSNCIIRPTSGNCVPVYDISYNYYTTISGKRVLDICNVTTNNVFCQWEPKCTFDNITSVSDRLSLNNSIIDQSIYDVTCCSGSSFYDNSAIHFNYSFIKDNITNISDCSAIKGHVRRSISDGTDLSYNRDFFDVTNRICNTLEPTGQLFNKKGMLFSKTESSFNILNDRISMPIEIINFISFSNIRNIINDILELPDLRYYNALNNFRIVSLNTTITQLTQLNDALVLKARNENLQRQLTRTDLTPAQEASFSSILTNLQNVFSVADEFINRDRSSPNQTIPGGRSLLTERRYFSYSLLNNDYTQYLGSGLTPSNANDYLLNSDQFFNCMGEKKTDISASFNSTQLADFSTNDYFGTSGRPIALGGLGDASYNALGFMQNTGYPSNNDLEMELKRLEIVPATGNAPVSVISSYLNAINSFYEKQLRNLSGPREHSYSQELVFDNNSLETKNTTFFTYNKATNNVYPCSPSILGNSTFEYCGPDAYYESPKF